jgi:hypothetical protein
MDTSSDTTLRPNSRPSARHRWLRRLWPIAILFLLLVAGRHCWRMWAARSIAGAYVMPDGVSFVVFEPGLLPALRVADGYVWALTFSPNPSMKIALTANATGTAMTLEQVQTFSEPMSGGRNVRVMSTTVLRLRRSTQTPGDWDLVGGGITVKGNDAYIAATSGNWQTFSTPSQGNSIWDRVENWLKRYGMKVSTTGELRTSEMPIPSFLHRVEDARLVSYCRERLKGPESYSDLEMIRAANGANTPDPCLGLHRVALEAQCGNLEESRRAWERWEAAYGASAHPFLRSTALRAYRILQTEEWRRRYPVEAAFWDGFLLDSYAPRLVGKTLPEYQDWLLRTAKCEVLNPAVKRLVPFSLSQPTRVPNFLQIQILGKVTRVLSTFALFEGDTQRSQELLTGLYWQGQSLNAGDVLIQKLIGVALRSMSIGALQLHALDGCRRPEELKVLSDALERLAKMPGQETAASTLDGELSPLVAHMKLSGFAYAAFGDVGTRQKAADAGFAILRTAVAARYHLLTVGAFPSTPAEFGPLLPEGPLADCFATSGSLRFRSLPEECFVYSIGPDARDDAAMVRYDPTNGTVSSGDIFLRVPREREYPFPEGGVRVDTAEDLLRIFPNGLPLDPFADKKGRPLSIVAASEEDWRSCALPAVRKELARSQTTAPSGSAAPSHGATLAGADSATSRPQVVLFSFGPDCDESHYSQVRRLTGENVFTTYSASAQLQLVFPPPAAAPLASVSPLLPTPSEQPKAPATIATAQLAPQSSQPTSASTSLPPRRKPGLLALPPGVKPGQPFTSVSPLGIGRAQSAATLATRPPLVPPYSYPATSAPEPYYDPTNGTTSKGNLYLSLPRRAR